MPSAVRPFDDVRHIDGGRDVLRSLVIVREKGIALGGGHCFGEGSIRIL
jgi:hypothetical protein